MRSGAVMSAVISRSARCWSAVSSQGRLCLSRVVRSRLTSKATPAPLALGDGAGADEHELEVEQLVEGEPPPAPLRLVGWTRADAPRAAPRPAAGSPAARRSGSGSRSSDSAMSASRCRSTSDADDPVAEPLGGGIDRQHLAGGERIGLALRVRQDDVFARRQLPAVVEPDRPGDQQRLPHGDGPVEERLARPDALEHAAVVAQHGVEDPEPAPGGQHALGDHPPDARDLLPDLRPDERGHGGGVDVAMGEVPEEIARGADAEPLELLGPPLADPLQELDRHVEPDGARRAAARLRLRLRHRRPRHAAARAFVANQPDPDAVRPADAPRTAAGRTARDRRAPRPTPMNRIGRSSSRRSAVTAPPRALPSSLVTTMPGGLTPPAAKSRPCWMAFWPTVPSSTSSVSCGAPGRRRPTTRTTFRSSSMRPSWVCSRPAVSTMTVSQPAGRRRVDGVERDRGRIAPRRAGDAGHAEPLGPDLELADGAGAVGVGRREQHLPALALEPARELGGGGGLAGAVDADQQDDRRAALASRQRARILRCRRAARRAGSRAPAGDRPRS